MVSNGSKPISNGGCSVYSMTKIMGASGLVGLMGANEKIRQARKNTALGSSGIKNGSRSEAGGSNEGFSVKSPSVYSQINAGSNLKSSNLGGTTFGGFSPDSFTKKTKG